MPKALILGTDRPESLEMSFMRALRAMGWDVESWDPRIASTNASRGGRLGRRFSSFVHVEPWVRRANLDLLRVVESTDPDLILIIGTGGLRAGTLAQVRVLAPNAKVYMVYPDSAHSLDTERIACLPICDRVTVSSPAWILAFERLGASKVGYLPFAADTYFYRLKADQTAAPEPRRDLCFVGTWRPEREELLESLSEFKTVVWGGSYWRTRTNKAGNVRKAWGGRELIGDEIVSACAESAIMLNILDPMTWPGPNMRSFEIPACGGFTLSTRTDAILELFEEGKTIECFSSAEEAKDKVRFYLSRPAQRRKIAEAAHSFVTKEGHTYQDRAQQIANWYSSEE